MSKKKRKSKKKLTLNELKAKLESLNSNVRKGNRIGFEMLKPFTPKIIDQKEKIEKKSKKHKKDYRDSE